jgi:3-hydroxyisobutyrate dehydrogenase
MTDTLAGMTDTLAGMTDTLAGRESMAEAPTVGWVGTGRMGAEMARRLLEAGFELVVFNRTREKALPLSELGAKVASSLGELSERDMVFTMVGSSENLVEVLSGPDGLLVQEASPRLVVDFSTVSEAASASARSLAASRGTEFLAAPVSGNPAVVRAGRLTMAVSGPRKAFEAALPYFEAIGAGATYMGDGEVARAVKICHNLLLGVITEALAEVTVLAQKRGVSRKDFLSYINRSVLGSLFTSYKAPALVNLDFAPTFTARLLRKDFDLGLAMARELEVPLPVVAVTREVVASLVGHGYGEADFAALIEQVAQSAGLRLESEEAEVPDGLGGHANLGRREVEEPVDLERRELEGPAKLKGPRN